MKYLLIFLFISTCSYAQQRFHLVTDSITGELNVVFDTLNTRKDYITPIGTEQEPMLTWEYCEIQSVARPGSNKNVISLDFGDIKFSQDRRLKDEYGKPVVFTTMVGALNYMGSLGWELIYRTELNQGQSLMMKIERFMMKRAVYVYPDDK